MPFPPLPPVVSLPFGITCLDTLQERPDMACMYVIERGDDVAIVETGTAHGIPRVLAYLAAHNIALERVRYVIVTHVHLDHAGGAGVLMAALPTAQLVVHKLGSRHMIDPSKLLAGATAVYGEAAIAKMYGQILPVPSARVISPSDGDYLPFADSHLQFIDSPGHARHHFSIWDPVSQGFFTGDTFGLCYPQFTNADGPWVMATTTPVQFDPQAWFNTLDRYQSYKPARMFLTHFGMVENVQTLSTQLRSALLRTVGIAKAHKNSPDRHHAIKQALFADVLAELRSRNCSLSQDDIDDLLALDLELNSQGLDLWLDNPA